MAATFALTWERSEAGIVLMSWDALHLQANRQDAEALSTHSLPKRVQAVIK